MARQFARGFGSACPGLGFYGDNALTSAPAGVTRQTVGGVECLQMTAGSSGSLIFDAVNTLSPASDFGDTDYRCWLLKFRLAGTLAAGAAIQFFTFGGAGDSTPYLFWVRQSNTTYKVALYTTGLAEAAISSSTYTTDTWIVIRIVADIAGNVYTVDIDGTNEMTHSANVQHVLGTLNIVGTASASYTHNFAWGALYVFDALADRPGDNLNVYFIYPNGDNETATFGDDNVNCNDGAGTYTNWDDWSGAVGSHGDHDSGTTFNVECGGNAGSEISTFSSVAVDASLTMDAAIFVTVGQINAAEKGATTYAVLKDSNSGTKAEIQNTVFNSASTWETHRTVHRTPPAGDWEDYYDSSDTFNHASATRKLYAGIRSVDTNTANDDHTAIGIELFFVDNDPPASGASTRRRTNATLMTPGVF